jgi:hypothetical protein
MIETPLLIIFDLDGTLAESKQPLSSDMGMRIAELLNNMPVAVMSGAGFPQFSKQFLAYLPTSAQIENLYLFPTSSAQCYAYRDKKWTSIYNHSFTEEEKSKIITSLQKVIDETGITANEAAFGERIEDRGAQISFSALGQNAPLARKSVWDPDRKKRSIFRLNLQKLIPEFEIRIGGTTTIDVTRKDISKKTGIYWLQKELRIPISNMLYVGDALYPGGNDSVVIETGINTQSVRNTDETALIIDSLI